MIESRIMPIIVLGDDDGLFWRKASYSAANGECIEVASAPGLGISIRDSKDPEGAILNCSADAFRSLLDAARRGVLPS